MTLIIGCVSPEFAIIGGDTQLSSGDLNRGNIKRSTQIKVNRCSKDFMFGILGKWSWYFQERDGSSSRYDEDEYLYKKIYDFKIEDKLKYLRKFIKSRDKLDATTVYVKANDENFELGSVSTTDKKNEDNHEVISRLKIEGIEFLFNESFYKAQNDYVEKVIKELREKYNLTNNLSDTIFLINNTILEVITKGKKVSVIDENGEEGTVTNTVGGYVTIQIMQHAQLNNPNNLFMCYRGDFNCLLDKTTNPFANIVNFNLKIPYIDNLAMIIKSYNSRFHANIKDALLELIIKQIDLIMAKGIIEIDLMNDLIEYINTKYDISIQEIEVENEETTEDIVGLELLLNNPVEDSINLNYLKRYF